jgi:nicotinate-nucleotide adenylyltransferase
MSLMKQLKRVGLYGGTFDPVHTGHIEIGRRLLELFALDEFWFIPAHVAPHKRGAKVSSPFHRYAMLALATRRDPRLLINTIELDAPEKPYTIDTLARLLDEARQSTATLFFVMGADSWMEIATWREWERLLQLTNHIVVTRPGYELSAAHVTPQIRERIVDLRMLGDTEVEQRIVACDDAKIYFTDVVEMNVSATAIRRAAQQDKQNLDQLVSPPVADYIRKYKLYEDHNETEFSNQTTGSAH